jgi:hypothetical protein
VLSAITDCPFPNTSVKLACHEGRFRALFAAELWQRDADMALSGSRHKRVFGPKMPSRRRGDTEETKPMFLFKTAEILLETPGSSMVKEKARGIPPLLLTCCARSESAGMTVAKGMAISGDYCVSR